MFSLPLMLIKSWFSNLVLFILSGSELVRDLYSRTFMPNVAGTRVYSRTIF